MSPEKKVIGRVILLFWNGSLFWGTCEFSFFFLLFLVKIYVLLQHGYSSNMLFWCVLRRMQPWVSWCLELGPSFVSGSPGAAKLIFEGFKLTADPRILASNRWKLPWCYSWFNMSCRIFYDFLWWSPLVSQKIAYQDLCQLSACRFTQLIYDFGIGILFQTVEVTPSTARQGYRGYPTIGHMKGWFTLTLDLDVLAHRCINWIVKRHVFLQLLNFLELPTSQSIHLGFEKWKAGCLKSWVCLVQWNCDKIWMTLWFLSKRFGIINFHFLSHVFNHICLELPPWFVQLVNLVKHLSDSFFLFSTVCCDSCWLGGDSPTKVIAACSRATRWAEAKQSPSRSFRLVRRVFVQGIERNSKRSFAVVSRCVLFDCFWFETVMWSFWIWKGCKTSAKRRFSKSQALHLFLEPNQARGWGVFLSCKDVHLTCFYTGLHSVLCHVAMAVPVQFPPDSQKCHYVQHSPSSGSSGTALKVEAGFGSGHPESWNLILDRWWWNPWWRCGTMGILFFFLSKTQKKSGVPGTDWFAVFFVFDSRCSVQWFSPFLTLWVLKRWPWQGQWNLTPSHTMREPWCVFLRR